MGVRKLMFPIALAILWVVMAALAMVDFASFSATTRQAPRVEQVPPRVSQPVPARSTVKVALR